MHAFDLHAPEIKYVKYADNTCFLISLSYALFYDNENVAENSVVSRLSSYLSFETVDFKNMIMFSSDILTDSVRNTG